MLESVIRYLVDEHPVELVSNRENGELLISFRLGDPDAYHATLQQVTAERPPRDD